MQKRVELGRALAMQPKLLLLDEPVAGMNLEETEDMARFILDVRDELRIPIVMVEHDMGLVMDLADRVLVVDFGKPICIGTPAEVSTNPDVIRAYLGQEHRTSGRCSMTAVAQQVSTKVTTVATRVRDRGRNMPDRIALREKDFGIWQEVSWADYWNCAELVGHALLALGIEPGDRVAMHSENRREWLYADVGAIAVRATTVGLYPTNPPRRGRLPAVALRRPGADRRGPGAGRQGAGGARPSTRPREDRLPRAARNPVPLHRSEADVLGGIPCPGRSAPRVRPRTP